MLATREDLPLDEDHLGARLEHLLHAYYQDGVPSADTSVPGSLVRSATTTGQQADTDEAASADQHIPDADAAGAAFLDSGVDDAIPLGLWTAAMKKYDVLLQCENHLAQSEKRSTERQEAQHARMRALGEAVQALQRLSSAEVFQQLRDFETRRQEHTLVLDLGRTDKLLDNNDPSFWLHCFCDLFYRADCWEKRQGPAKLHGRRWARALLKRADFSGWVLSKEFAATAANVFMRRDQMAAVHTWLRAEHGFARIRDTLSSLSVQDLVAAATSQAGDFRSLAQALQCKPARGAKLHQIFREMMVVLRDIEGSEEHRAGAIYKMRSLRVWAGCSFLFFTLNPLDHQNPLFVSYVNSQTTLLERINLCGTDTEMEGYFRRAKLTDTLLLRRMAVKNPCAAMRCVRFVMERTIDTLMNCSPPANKKPQAQHLDLIASNTEPGVWQHVAAYFGVVETTKTLREHLHMLVHLLGFAHPEDLFQARLSKPQENPNPRSG